jgi:hypothetical protein
MSIKINNGYELLGMSTISDIFDFCEATAVKIQAVQREEVLTLMGLYLSMEFDLAIAARHELVDDTARPFRINDCEGSVLDQVTSQVARRILEAGRSQMRDPEFDMSANLAIFRPLTRAGVKVHPAMLFTERIPYVEAWRRSEQVLDFHYQSAEEKPGGIPEEEWECRRATWASVLPHNVPPVECSLGFRLDSTTLPFSIREKAGLIIDHVPDFEMRVATLARLIASHEKSIELVGERDVSEFSHVEKVRMSQQIALWLFEYRDEILERLGGTIRDMIPRDITLERVLQPMNQAI